MYSKLKKPIIEYSNDYSEYLFIILNIWPIIPIIRFYFF
jgi:hypothetical protein